MTREYEVIRLVVQVAGARATAMRERGAGAAASGKLGKLVARRVLPRAARAASPPATLAAAAPHHCASAPAHLRSSDTLAALSAALAAGQHASARRYRASRHRGVDPSLVARPGGRDGRHGTTRVARSRVHDAGEGVGLRAADAPRTGVRLHSDRQRDDIRARVRCAYEPRHNAGGAGARAHRAGAGAGVRGGADGGRGARVRRAGGRDAGARAGGPQRLHGARAARERGGRGGGGGGAHGAAGAGLLRRLGRARRRASRPLRARQAGALGGRPRIRRGFRYWCQFEPGSQFRTCLVPKLLGEPLGVLGGPAGGRGAGGAAAPLRVERARAARRRARGRAAQRQALTPHLTRTTRRRHSCSIMLSYCNKCIYVVKASFFIGNPSIPHQKQFLRELPWKSR